MNQTHIRPTLGRLLSVSTYSILVILFQAVRIVNPVLLKYDDGYFLLVSYSWLNGLGFANDWAGRSSPFFNWHGFMQPMLIAALAPCNTLHCVNLGLFAIGFIYLVVWYFFVNSVGQKLWIRWVLYIIGFASVLQFSARPELLASLEMNVLTITLVTSSPRTNYVVRGSIAGALVGVIAVTHPVAGGLAGLGVAGYISYLRRNDINVSDFIAEGIVGASAALACAAFALVFVYPHDVLSWVDGIRQELLGVASKGSGDGGDGFNWKLYTQQFLKYYVFTRMYPLQVLMFVPLVAAGIYSAQKMWSGSNRMVFAFFVSACLSFAYLLYFTAIRVPPAFYNFSGLIPAVALVAVALTSSVQQEIRFSAAIFGLPLNLFALACGSALVILVGQKLYYGPDYSRLSNEIAAAVDGYLAKGSQIAMDPPLMLAVDDIEKLKKVQLVFFGKFPIQSDGKARIWPNNTDVLFLAQTEFGTLPEIRNSRLVRDAFIYIPIVRYLKPEGMYYAIYEADPPIK